MSLVKRTSTLDPMTGRVVPAEIVEEQGGVYLIRDDTRVLIEPDVELYRLLTHHRDEVERIQHLVVEPTYACNQSCPFCFIAGQEDDFSMDDLRHSLQSFHDKVVSISGGEPTILKELPEIIRLVNEMNIPLLATNGIRLADPNYVQMLHDAGLRHVTFSLNGFSERSLVRTNGVALLESKLKALENLEDAGMECLLSVLLKRGLNEGEIPALFEFAHAHPRLVREVRIRSTGSIGKFSEHQQFFTSEILALLCDALGLKADDIVRELQFQKQLMKAFPSIRFSMRSCGMTFHLVRTERGFRPLGKNIVPGDGLRGLVRNRRIIRKMLSRVLVSRNWASGSRKRIWRHSVDLLKVVIRSWPRPDAIDLIDHSRLCGSRYLTGRKTGKPVCYANILLNIGGHR